MQILEEDKGSKSAKILTKEKEAGDGRKSKDKPTDNARKKTTDELIEEYERKINNTKSLLEEEKKRVAKKTDEAPMEESADDLLNNLTPEFKGKPNEKQPKTTLPPQLMQANQLHSYLTEFSAKGYLSGQDNAKLLKQIKNCFNDNKNINIGSVTLSTTPQGGIVAKSKQKLNKSYENLLAANKGKTTTDVITAKALLAKKNLSTSPRRGSSSGKKSGSSRGGGAGNKRKYLQQ